MSFNADHTQVHVHGLGLPLPPIQQLRHLLKRNRFGKEQIDARIHGVAFIARAAKARERDDHGAAVGIGVVFLETAYGAGCFETVHDWH